MVLVNIATTTDWKAVLKVIRKFFFKTNIFIADYTSVSPKKQFAKNLEFCEPKNCDETAVKSAKL